jgi:imidazolonepropionase-like amidohydrolase
MKAMVDEAHRERHRVASHAQSTEGVESALAAGVDSIEHGIYMTNEQIAAMKKQGIVYVPTLWDVGYSAERRKSERLEKMFEIGKQTLRRTMRAELKIAFGTDIGGFDWRISPAKQMQLFVEIGMSPRQAILTSIKNGAELMRLENDIGTLQPGKFADVIVVSGNPLENITALEQVQLTVRHGAVFRHYGD